MDLPAYSKTENVNKLQKYGVALLWKTSQDGTKNIKIYSLRMQGEKIFYILMLFPK